jgi:hypothetical protein
VTSRRTPRWARLVATTVVVGVVAAGCGSTDDAAEAPTATSAPASDDSAEPRVVSAEEGAAARARYAPVKRSADVASESLLTDSPTADCGVDYVPTPEEIAATNSDAAGLTDAFDRFGIEYSSTTDEAGYLLVEYAYNDVVAQSIADSYWAVRYPPEPIPQEELDEIVAHNDVVAAQLDAAGLTYERLTDDSGYESIEYDYDDPVAQAAVDAAWQIIFPPQPPTAAEAARQTKDNDTFMQALDAAGLSYELVTDELGWAWVEWDDSDPATVDRYYEVIDELYPPIMIDPIVGCELALEPAAPSEPAPDVASIEPIEPVGDDVVVEEPELLPIEPEFTPEDVARRDAEVTAMADGFAAASVEFTVVGESPWQSVVFDIGNDASVTVITEILAARS